MELNRDILRKLPLALRIEIEENLQRKDFPPSELARVWRAVEAHARTAAEQITRAHPDWWVHAGTLS